MNNFHGTFPVGYTGSIQTRTSGLRFVPQYRRLTRKDPKAYQSMKLVRENRPDAFVQVISPENMITQSECGVHIQINNKEIDLFIQVVHALFL